MKLQFRDTLESNKKVVCVLLCYALIRLHITAQSDPAILVILCNSHWPSRVGQWYLFRKPLIRLEEGDILYLESYVSPQRVLGLMCIS